MNKNLKATLILFVAIVVFVGYWHLLSVIPDWIMPCISLVAAATGAWFFIRYYLLEKQ